MIDSSLNRAIEEMGGPEGWWHTSNQETYVRLAEKLTRYGIPESEIIDILSAARAAAADEFGA